MSPGGSAFLGDDESSDIVFLVDAQNPGERYLSLEELEEGYDGDSDGPDHDGYTAQERELREIGGVAGMSMEILSPEMESDGTDESFEDPDYDFDD
jgi:hypothetical protein